MKRREFCKLSLITAIGLSAPLAWASTPEVFSDIDWDNARLSLRAYRSVEKGGAWSLQDIEGEVPKELKGRLLRVGPGNKVNHKTRLKHFFDGDAFYQSFVFNNGEVSFEADYIQTPEREQELKSGRMLFNEFGTMAPKKTRKLKNQPNISIVPWRGNFLALSEGGHPVLLDGQTLEYIEQHDFMGTLPKNVSFTAHPKFDPVSGKGYAFGINQGMSMAIIVYEMDPKTGKLNELYNMSQSKVFMIHDFMVSENYIAFLIPPAYFKLTDIIFNRGSMADALTYNGNGSTRLLVLENKKGGRRWETTLPASMIFHNGNLYEEDGVLHFTSCQARNGSLLGHIAKWHTNATRGMAKPNVYQWSFDLKANKVLSKKTLAHGHDFPNFAKDYSGKRASFLYSAEMGDAKDPMRFVGVSKISIDSGIVAQYKAAWDETLGEPVFQAFDSKEEDNGFVFVPGFSGSRDESFLDILNAKDMKRQARLWLGEYFPVGFHGNFIS